MKKKILSLLVLLVAAVSGAWATDAVPAYNLSVAESDHGSGTISYTVQDKDDAEKITENAKGANEGDLVTVTVTADEGWVVGSVTASTNNTWEAAGARRKAPAAIPMLGDVTLTPVEGKANTWTFTMPAANVKVKVGYLATSNLYLSKDALADKANIAVTAGETTVEFDDDGKSANTVTEGTTVTTKYNGTKKVLGVKVEKKAKAAGPITVTLTPGEIGDLTSGSTSKTINGITIEVSGDAKFHSGNGWMEVSAYDPDTGDPIPGDGTYTFTSSVGKIKRIDINHNVGKWWGSGAGWPGSYEVDDTSTFTWSGTPAASVTLNGSFSEGDQCSLYSVSSFVFTIEPTN